MKTIILAGGFGTRLQPLVKDLPKPLAPIQNKSFLEHLILSLSTQGLKDFIFCLHYMADKVMAEFRDGSQLGVQIQYSVEKEPLGTGGALSLLRDSLTEPFLVLNADTYLDLDITAFKQFHKTKLSLLTLAVTQVPDASRYGVVKMDNDLNITGFIEKGNIPTNEAGWINAGFYIMQPEILKYIPPHGFTSLEKDVFPRLIKDKYKVMAYGQTKNFFDIGIPEDYLRFIHWMKDGSR